MSFPSLTGLPAAMLNRKTSIERPGLGKRNLSIELLPNQSVFRETFIGSSVPKLSSPLATPTEESFDCKMVDSASTTPIHDMFASPPKSSISGPVTTTGKSVNYGGSHSPPLSPSRSSFSAKYKRHAIIIPSRFSGDCGPMTPPPTGALPALPTVEEDCFMSWERRGTSSVAFNTPTPQPHHQATDYFSAQIPSSFSASSPSYASPTFDLSSPSNVKQHSSSITSPMSISLPSPTQYTFSLFPSLSSPTGMSKSASAIPRNMRHGGLYHTSNNNAQHHRISRQQHSDACSSAIGDALPETYVGNGGRAGDGIAVARPGTPTTPVKEYRSFMRSL